MGNSWRRGAARGPGGGIPGGMQPKLPDVYTTSAMDLTYGRLSLHHSHQRTDPLWRHRRTWQCAWPPPGMESVHRSHRRQLRSETAPPALPTASGTAVGRLFAAQACSAPLVLPLSQTLNSRTHPLLSLSPTPLTYIGCRGNSIPQFVWLSRVGNTFCCPISTITTGSGRLSTRKSWENGWDVVGRTATSVRV